MDQVTQRNAAAAEELSSTSEELASQAEALRLLMSFFRVSSETPPAQPPAVAADDPFPLSPPAPLLEPDTGFQRF